MIDIEIGSLIKYNFLYSNEKDKIGVVCKIKNDPNFSYIIYVLLHDQVIQVPYSIMELKEIEYL